MTTSMKRRQFLKAGAVAVPAAALATPAIAQGNVEWKLPTSFPAKAPGVGTNSASFAKRVAEMSDGRLTFKIFSGGELVPPFGVEDAVQQGTAEIGHSTPYYAAGKNSALHFFSTVPFGMTATEHESWLKFGGGQALWDEIAAERAGAVVAVGDGVEVSLDRCESQFVDAVFGHVAAVEITDLLAVRAGAEA